MILLMITMNDVNVQMTLFSHVMSHHGPCHTLLYIAHSRSQFFTESQTSVQQVAQSKPVVVQKTAKVAPRWPQVNSDRQKKEPRIAKNKSHIYIYTDTYMDTYGNIRLYISSINILYLLIVDIHKLHHNTVQILQLSHLEANRCHWPPAPEPRRQSTVRRGRG